MAFLIVWLLCSVAFMICHQPTDTQSVLKSVVAGVLVAIAICFVPGAISGLTVR